MIFIFPRKIVYLQNKISISKEIAHFFLKWFVFYLFIYFVKLLKQNSHVEDSVKLYILLLILLFGEDIFTAFFYSYLYNSW